MAEMNIPDALKQVLRTAMNHNGLARGLREVTRVLDRGTAHLCVLAESCDEPAYGKLIEALCIERQINLMKALGEWAGLCKYDAEGKARNVVGCSCVAVTDFGEPSAAVDFIINQFAKK